MSFFKEVLEKSDEKWHLYTSLEKLWRRVMESDTYVFCRGNFQKK